ELLKPHDEFALNGAAVFQKQHVTYELEQFRIDVLAMLLRFFGGFRNIVPVKRAHFARTAHEIGPVNGKARHYLAQGALNVRPRVIAMIAMAFADLYENRNQPRDVASENVAQHQKLVLPTEVLKPDGFTGELLIRFRDPLQPFRIDKETTHLIQKIVAGGPVNGPVCAKRFARLQNLFGHYPAVWSGGSQPLEILFRIAQ